MLRAYPLTRNNDNELLARIWEQDMRDKGTDFLTALRLGLLTNAESIRRCRAKLQQINPDFRGNQYEFRTIQEQENVKSDLINFHSQ